MKYTADGHIMAAEIVIDRMRADREVREDDAIRDIPDIDNDDIREIKESVTMLLNNGF
jgi:hypothetical protein